MENFEEFQQEVIAEIKANPHMYPSVCRGMVGKIEAQQVEITALTHDLANEREKVERLRKQVEFDCSNPIIPCPDIAELRAEVERLREAGECFRSNAEKAEAERDRYKAAYDLVRRRLSDEQTAPATMPACLNLIAEADALVAAGAVHQEETCDSCHGDLGDDAPVYEDADICRSCHNALQAAEAVRPLSGTLFLCPNCGAPHFNAIVGGFLVCANVTAHTDFRVKPGGCGWSGQVAEAVQS